MHFAAFAARTGRGASGIMRIMKTKKSLILFNQFTTILPTVSIICANRLDSSKSRKISLKAIQFYLVSFDIVIGREYNLSDYDFSNQLRISNYLGPNLSLGLLLYK